MDKLYSFSLHFFFSDTCYGVHTLFQTCLIKLPGSLMVATLTLIHFFIFVERVMAMKYRQTYERNNSRFGGFASVAIVSES